MASPVPEGSPVPDGKSCIPDGQRLFHMASPVSEGTLFLMANHAFRMDSPERAIYRAGSLTLSLGCMQRVEYQTLTGLFPWRVTPLHKYDTHVIGVHVGWFACLAVRV